MSGVLFSLLVVVHVVVVLKFTDGNSKFARINNAAGAFALGNLFQIWLRTP